MKELASPYERVGFMAKKLLSKEVPFRWALGAGYRREKRHLRVVKMPFAFA